MFSPRKDACETWSPSTSSDFSPPLRCHVMFLYYSSRIRTWFKCSDLWGCIQNLTCSIRSACLFEGERSHSEQKVTSVISTRMPRKHLEIDPHLLVACSSSPSADHWIQIRMCVGKWTLNISGLDWNGIGNRNQNLIKCRSDWNIRKDVSIMPFCLLCPGRHRMTWWSTQKVHLHKRIHLDYDDGALSTVVEPFNFMMKSTSWITRMIKASSSPEPDIGISQDSRQKLMISSSLGSEEKTDHPRGLSRRLLLDRLLSWSFTWALDPSDSYSRRDTHFNIRSHGLCCYPRSHKWRGFSLQRLPLSHSSASSLLLLPFVRDPFDFNGQKWQN